MVTPVSRLALIAAAGAMLGGAAATSAIAQDAYFTRIASFPVSDNAPDGRSGEETSAEIIAVSGDGMTLIYSDSPLEAIGLIDISEPSAPAGLGVIELDGEPTAVSAQGERIYAAVNTSESYTETSGSLLTFDLQSRDALSRCDLGGQPDSTAVAPDGSFIAIAIENERDEDLNDGVIPQLPAGSVAIFTLGDGGIPDCDSRILADVTGLAEVAGSDPEPEFVDINADGEIAVTLQENNHIVILDSSGAVLNHFSAGAVDLENVDLDEERALTFDGVQPNRVREPDAVQWLDGDRLVIANEGDYKGGSRGFTIFSQDGAELFESGLDLEYRAAMAGHYPERRSGNKGVEPEGMEIAEFAGETYIFVLLERSSLVGVYRDTGGEPEFVQLLPSGVGPEGAIAIPSRDLFVTANEVDLIEDGGVRAHVMVYAYGADAPSYPTIQSVMDENGRPIGWGALSGLVADPDDADRFYAVNDSFYALQPSIFVIDASESPATITDRIAVTRNGAPAQLMDLEGVALDGEGGFWLASEGRTDRMVPHGLYHVNGDGEIESAVPFPAELLAVERRFGSEGVTMVDGVLWIAIQREWADDEKGQVKLVSYDPESEAWGYVRYPLESADTGWVGLSEITYVGGDVVYIVERDNQIGAAAKIKRVYSVPLAQMTPAPLGEAAPLVEKTLVADLLDTLREPGGYVVDKVEGFAITADGEAYILTDNDGVDDSSGESHFLKLDETF